METLEPVMSVIKACASACSQIKQWFEPFFWVLVRSHSHLHSSDYRVRAKATPERSGVDLRTYRGVAHK